MNNAKHTPGPWEYLATNANTLNDYTRTIFASVGECVAHVETNDDDGNPTEKGEANARLIAAAPELLAELAGIIAAWDADPDGRIGVARMNDARAIIAKATGQQ